MSRSALKRELLKALDLRLATIGFRRVKRGRIYGDPYSREHCGIRHTIGMGIRLYLDGLETEIGNASVRFDDVEELVARFQESHPLVGPQDIAARSTVTEQLSSSTPTRGDPLYHWGGTDRRIWLITSVDQIPVVASEMADYVLEKCEPVFKRLSDRETAIQALSNDGFSQFSAESAIALAFLLHGEAAARQLAKVKLSQFKGDSRAELSKWVSRFLENVGEIQKGVL